MTDIEQAARDEAWKRHLRSKRNHRQARRSSFDAGWDALAEHLLSDESYAQEFFERGQG